MTKPNLDSKPKLRPDVSDLRRQEEAGAHIMSARNALRKGERKRARDEIKKAFAINPGDVSAVDLMGDMLLEEGETEKALALYLRALQQHPKNPIFEEKIGLCRLDLAEMENDRIAKTIVIDGDANVVKFIERVPHKAVSLSLFLPGAGQFYNEENEKGIAFLVAGLVCCIGWFYPMASAMQTLRPRDYLNLPAILGAMSSTSTFVFWASLTLWSVVYVASMIDAGTSASRWNYEQRKARGLES